MFLFFSSDHHTTVTLSSHTHTHTLCLFVFNKNIPLLYSKHCKDMIIDRQISVFIESGYFFVCVCYLCLASHMLHFCQWKISHVFVYNILMMNSRFLFLFPGCLLDGAMPTAPPDVPPRNPTMSRMNGRVTGNPSELGVDFEPSCLVRTPSGNVYIPSGNISKYL